MLYKVVSFQRRFICEAAQRPRIYKFNLFKNYSSAISFEEHEKLKDRALYGESETIRFNSFLRDFVLGPKYVSVPKFY